MEQFGDSPRHNYLDPRLFNVSMPTSVKINENQDQIIIDQWLVEKGKFQSSPYLEVTKPISEVTLSGAKQALKNCLDIVDKLNKTQEQLRNNVESMSLQDWKLKTQDIGTLKDEFDKTMLMVEDESILKNLKGMVVKRNKKRLNQRKQKKAQQELNKLKKEKQIEIHKSIDRWMQSKKEEAERVKMVEKMKKDADCVLYEVTKKKSEARRQLSLISALVKLRTVRDNMAMQRGEKTSLEDRKAFGLVTEKLVSMWENSYQTYRKEEHCLNVMLEDNATKDTRAATKQTHIARDWESFIFGPKDIPFNNPTYWALISADRDLESFVAIRKSWDTFLTNPDYPSGSAIPTGWVIPPNKPNENWACYLKND